MSGDVDGDGLNTNTDLEISKALIINSMSSTEHAKIAAEFTGDGRISTADYLKLKHVKSCSLLIQSAPSTVVVPDLAGKSEKDAKSALERLGLIADIRYTTSGETGKVAYQKTEAGAKAGEGAKICVVVASDGKYTPLNYDRMKGVWLFQYTTGSSLFKTGSSQKAESQYRKDVSTIIDCLSRDGFNTVFLQMRPYGDSLYPNSVYPPSPYVTSKGSLDYSGSFIYDPLEVFIEIAHKKGISVHAWLNPMRLMKKSAMWSVPEDYRIGKWYKDSSKEGDYIVAYGDRYYLNPAYKETRQLVVDGCMEICRNYDIDGLHFDDYFYISIDDESEDLAFDQKSFDKLGSGSAYSLEARKTWRRHNVNLLLKEIFSSVKAYDSKILFGISPAGNIENNQTGYLCADVRTWCSTPGYIDYIAPQVYWSFSHTWTPAKFNVCTDNWADMVTCSDVRLIIGLAPYRAVNPGYSSSDPDWYYKRDNIKRMLEYTKKTKKCTGFIMFKYESIYNLPSGTYNSGLSEEISNFMPLIPKW